jgi:hypothetical protein
MPLTCAYLASARRILSILAAQPGIGASNQFPHVDAIALLACTRL